MIFGCVAVFIVLKARYPVMFYYASLSGAVPDKPAEDYTSWITLSEKKVHEEHRKYSGLDHAMLLEFTSMCYLALRCPCHESV